MFLFRNSARSLNKLGQISIFNNRIGERQIKRWVAPTLRELKRRKDKLGEEKPSPRSSFLEWNYEAEVYAFGKRLGENFDRELLKRALIHRSYANVKKDEGQEIEHNSELIEQGSQIINEFLREEFSKIYTDDVTNALIKYLTSDSVLSHVAKHLGLTDLIFTSEFPVEEATLADTFKAIIAALELSDNLERSQKFIKDFLLVQLNGKTVFDIWEPENPVDYLNNLLKKQGVGEFEARLCNESASNTILANYQVGLYSNDKKLLGIGWGENVDIAKNTAALDAIRRLCNL
ncbi:39S ribosomal protein L44, mitochondrial [Coccinella septempunctata]|uniref:39S ribosomal protein L44, mitochondrial n=1 Tax=Coccinella septempunctata TaxID=41139 RepID=UPI001D06BDA8|nr:39S ribosomal protein L44, mitochondrial [Coccinella septempunctata]